ncbi:MAG: flagellar M-ring protein FliF [Limimaricola sp.]|uniref:flagellar basal-body MS-ring/collar protein FliF n=1 Tax=Limimaricola sp. TaxID=2211665 RepID=UPI001DF2C227|nr:flagellar basal-body MS-ring/collar protein FliF [Limimaricola sp.]MBI1417352.1 flagellar M-ring protein FliF [Limimaricola sp.]
MDAVLSLWRGLDLRRRMAVIGATLAVFAAVLLLAARTGQGDMALLYSGLDPTAAGEVLTALDQQAVKYDVRGSAIYVDASRRDVLRMTLAGQGLPASSAQGYEILDGLSGFGTTAQMFDAAYWRAKEGELARTILASPYVRAARVHISTPAASPFARDQHPTAAVTVTTSGGALSGAHAQAVRYLISGAVAGMAPEDVAVIDADRGLIPADDAAGLPGASARAAELRDRATRLLEARVGPGNAVVEVSLEPVTQTEKVTERTIAPDSRVAISTDVQEKTDASQDAQGNAVTVASNLPAGAGAGGGSTGGSSSSGSETRQLTNYDVSETRREVVRAAGAVKRLTVAVLVNDTVVTDSAGKATVTPRSPDELDALKALVASAVGLDETRGDVITIRAMAFEALSPPGTEAAVAATQPLDTMTLIQVGVLALVSLILGLFVVRPVLLSGRTAALPPPMPAMLPGTTASATAAATGDALALPGGSVKVEATPPEPEADPVERLRALIDSRQNETLQILRSWIEEPEEAEQA